MTIVAILFASAAIGQKGTWPADSDADFSKAKTAGRVDTVYFCERADSLYPIDLGYDGLGLRLHPSYGKWSLIATSNNNVAADYNLSSDANPGNGGAGNAFKTTGTKFGGYVFQYDAEDVQCGLLVGEKFYVYVFIFPDKNDIIDKDTLVCQTDPSDGKDYHTFKFSSSFEEYIDLYITAGIFTAPDWGTDNGEHAIRTDSIAVYPLSDTLKINLANAPKGYTCGSEIRFQLIATVVDEIGQLTAISKTRCADDTVSLANSDPNIIFERTNVTGSYSPTTIGAAPSSDVTVGGQTLKKKVFTFSYTECGGGGIKTVTDELYLLPNYESGQNATNWGSDTVIVCRTPGVKSIFTFYNDSLINYPLVGKGKLDLNLSNSYWFDRGLTGKDGLLTGIYGTINGGPSLHDGSYDVLVDSLRSNMGYHYLWRPDAGAFPCLVDENGYIDTGIVVVIIQDEIVAQDYTAQLCQDSYLGSHLSLNKYTGLNVAWSGLGIINNDSIDVSFAGKGTHKYTYNIPPKCGPGGPGVFYVKISPVVKVASSKTVRYCISKLPAMINLNDVLNVAVKGLEWNFNASESTNGLTINSDIFNPETGILNILEFSPENQTILNSDVKLVFKVNANSGCGISAGTTVVLEFVSSI